MQVLTEIGPGCKVYVSAAFGRRKDVEVLCRQLAHRSVSVVSTWHRDGSDLSESDDRERMLAAARKDLDELRRADVYVVLAQPQQESMGRGGRHVELGAALAWEIPVVVLGGHENVFHSLAVATFEDADALLGSVGQAVAAAP